MNPFLTGFVSELKKNSAIIELDPAVSKPKGKKTVSKPRRELRVRPREMSVIERYMGLREARKGTAAAKRGLVGVGLGGAAIGYLLMKALEKKRPRKEEPASEVNILTLG